MNNVNLFDEFEPISKKEWKQQVIADLKGKDFEQLMWHTEGLTIVPLYAQEDLITMPSGGLGFTNNNKHQTEHIWQNLEKVTVHNAHQANIKALEALNHGADGIIFQMLDNEIPEFDTLLKNIVLESCTLYFEGNDPLAVAFQHHISHSLTNKNLNGGLLCPFSAAQKDLTLEDNTLFKSHFIPFSEGSIVQQLVATLRRTAKVMDTLSDKGIAPGIILKNLIIKFEVGSSYFKEIAKLRACRILIAALAKAYEVEDFVAVHFHIHVETSNASQPEEDTYNNMLRNTTQAMSAILGGCNSIYVHPHSDRKEDDNFSRRMARNIPLILKEEAYFGKAIDPAAGSYYLENLTHVFAEEAWVRFLSESAPKA